jgi:hypothetical protein
VAITEEAIMIQFTTWFLKATQLIISHDIMSLARLAVKFDGASPKSRGINDVNSLEDKLMEKATALTADWQSRQEERDRASPRDSTSSAQSPKGKRGKKASGASSSSGLGSPPPTSSSRKEKRKKSRSSHNNEEDDNNLEATQSSPPKSSKKSASFISVANFSNKTRSVLGEITKNATDSQLKTWALGWVRDDPVKNRTCLYTLLNGDCTLQECSYADTHHRNDDDEHLDSLKDFIEEAKNHN